MSAKRDALYYQKQKDKIAREDARSEKMRGGMFRGDRFVYRDQIEAEKAHKKALEMQGLQNIGNYNVADRGQIGQTNRKNIDIELDKEKLLLDESLREKAYNDIQKKEFIDFIRKGTSPTYDESGEIIAPPKYASVKEAGEDYANMMRFANERGKAKSLPSEDIVIREDGRREAYRNGMLDGGQPYNTKEGYPGASDGVTSKQSPINKPRTVEAFTGVQPQNNALNAYNSVGNNLNERLAPARDVYRSFKKNIGVPIGESITQSVKKRQRKPLFDFNNWR